MGDIKGFLKHGRAKIPKRPVDERVRDYRWVYEPMPEKELRVQASRCIDCGACEPECPVEAIYPEDEVPEEMESYITKAATYFE